MRAVWRGNFDSEMPPRQAANGRISVDGWVSVHTHVTRLPVQFETIGGDFKCDSENLETLEGSPRWVKGGVFINPSPPGKLRDLRGGPQTVGGDYSVTDQALISLEGAPAHVGGDFFVRNCDITNLRGAPRSTGGNFVVIGCPLTSLEGLPQSVDNLLILNVDRNVGLLRVLMVDTPMEIELRGAGDVVNRIINRYRNRGVNGVMPCAAELIKAGYRGNARL
jgi:hypothetical protein